MVDINYFLLIATIVLLSLFLAPLICFMLYIQYKNKKFLKEIQKSCDLNKKIFKEFNI